MVVIRSERTGPSPFVERVRTLLSDPKSLNIDTVAEKIINEFGIHTVPFELVSAMLQEPTKPHLYEGGRDFLVAARNAQDLNIIWSAAPNGTYQQAKVDSAGLVTLAQPRIWGNKVTSIGEALEVFEGGGLRFIDNDLSILRDTQERIQRLREEGEVDVPEAVEFYWMKMDPATSTHSSEPGIIEFLGQSNVHGYGSFGELTGALFPEGAPRRPITERYLNCVGFDRTLLDIRSYGAAVGRRIEKDFIAK